MLEHGDFELAELNEILRSPIWHVLEHGGENAVNVGGATVRHFHGTVWLYQDNSDGWSLLEEEDVERLDLCTANDPRVRNEWTIDGRVERDGVEIEG